jgi:hypothetical protein
MNCILKRVSTRSAGIMMALISCRWIQSDSHLYFPCIDQFVYYKTVHGLYGGNGLSLVASTSPTR